MVPANHLKTLRNDVPILAVILDLPVATKWRGRRLTFQCPECQRFHTALNHRANLASCFRCRRSFNTIDLVMAVGGGGFLEAVGHLEGLIGSTRW